MKLEIKNYRDCVTHCEQIISWQNKEWPNRPLYEWMRGIKNLESNCIQSQYPIMYVAFSNNKPTGCIAIVQNDMDNFAKNSENPWLSHLYVTPSLRNIGIGTFLFDYCIRDAKNHNISRLYLFTSTIEKLALSRDWITLRNQSFENQFVVVMYKII